MSEDYLHDGHIEGLSKLPPPAPGETIAHRETTQDALMQSKMQDLKRQILHRLNADLFKDDGEGFVPVPPTALERLKRWLTRVKWYLITLGRALRGDELY